MQYSPACAKQCRMLLFSVKYLIYRQFFSLCFWKSQVSYTKLSKTRRQAKVMIFLLECNRHASIACNNSRFYRVLQNSRSVKFIRYINYLYVHFCRVLGCSNSFIPPFFFFFFLFSSHWEFQCMNSFNLLKTLPALSPLDWVPYPLGIYTCCSGISEWSLKSNSRSDLTVAGSSAVSHYPLSYQEEENKEKPKKQI